MKAVCEVVGKKSDGGAEVRFYANGICVKTVHVAPGDKHTFVEGETYDVEPDPLPADAEDAPPELEPADGAIAVEGVIDPID